MDMMMLLEGLVDAGLINDTSVDVVDYNGWPVNSEVEGLWLCLSATDSLVVVAPAE